MTVTFWGRVGDAETVDAQQFLKRHGYRPDRVLNIDATPPAGTDLVAIERAGPLPSPLPAPILLTPRGALVGFRERKWTEFLDIGKGRA